MHQRIELDVPLLVAEIGQMKRYGTFALNTPLPFRATWMGASVGFLKRRLLSGREMTDIKNGVEVLHRDRDLVRRIGDLADKAAVLAHRVCQPEAHARRALVEHRLENALVGGNGT